MMTGLDVQKRRKIRSGRKKEQERIMTRTGKRQKTGSDGEIENVMGRGRSRQNS